MKGMLRLVGGHHVPSVVYLQEGQAVGRPSKPPSIVPVLLLCRLELGLVVPIKVESPGTVAHVVADKVDIAGVNECGDAFVEQVRDIGGKVLHPINMEAHVD